MNKIFYFILLVIASLSIIFICDKNHTVSDHSENYDVFSFEQSLILPGQPETIFDALTGDISGWWDHSFSEHPHKLYIEPKAGGGFYEIFNEKGDGVLHATVTASQRGKLLRFDGPLGLAGKAVHLVCTYQLEAAGSDSTRLTLQVHAAGEIEEGVPAIVEKVWHHFLFERFKPFVESGIKKK